MAEKYALDRIVFNLVPEGLPAPDLYAGDTPNRETAEDTYRLAYKMIYNQWPRTELGKGWKAAVANARAADMDFKTYCLYIIAGYAVTHEFTKFFPNNLCADGAFKKVEGYRKACLAKFGASDARSLGLILDLDFHDIDEELFLSEVNFGRRMVMLVDVDNPCVTIYAQDEIAFSPYWLAIEGTYYDTVFLPFREKSMKVTHMEKHKLGTEAQLRHRHLVSQTIGALKRRSHISSTIFTARSRIMFRAAKSVLDHHGMKPSDPISSTAEVVDAFYFWTELAQAVKARKEQNVITDTV